MVGTTALVGALAAVGNGSPWLSGGGVSPVMLVAVSFAAALIAGFVISEIADALVSPLVRGIEDAWERRRGAMPLGLEGIRNRVLSSDHAAVTDRLAHHQTLIRLCGRFGFLGLLLVVLAVVRGRAEPAWLFALLGVAGFFGLRRRVLKVCEILAQAWETVGREAGPERSAAAVHPSLARLEDGVSVRALIFAGGTAFRNCNIALARRGHRVTRIVPSWDNGGSSRMLREKFRVLSIGDIRQALMTMAHGENISNEVIRLFNCRLSEDGNAADLETEMRSFLDQKHPRMSIVPTDLRNVILKYLETFWSQRPESLDLRNGSIGNLVMLGAYLAHGNDMNTAIYVFRQLCGINGNVWPITLENDLQLCARLADGEIVVGEENVTDISRPEVESRIEEPVLTRDVESREPASVVANPLVVAEFGNVDAIVFGPGSFFSSVLPHLMIAGVADGLAAAPAPKLFVGNMREGNECYGWSVAELVALFLATCHRFASEKRPASAYLTHIVAHDSTTHGRTVKGDRYLAVGDLEPFRRDGISVAVPDLEDPWRRGAHDANVLAQHIIDAGRPTAST